MDEFLKSLKTKEKEILIQLEDSPLFRQLESLRNTISAFEGNGTISSHNGHAILNENLLVASSYDATNFTWKQRVLFVIGKCGRIGVSEIVEEIQKLEPNAYTKSFLDKRVGVTVAQLKKKEEIVGKKEGKRLIYSIK